MIETTRTLETLELVGGALCLDFVNTINSRVHPEHDYLVRYSDLVEWAAKVRVLAPAKAGQLQKQAKQNTKAAEDTVEKARMLRELLYRLFSSAANEVESNKKDKEAFVSAYGESISHGQLTKTDNHYTTSWNMGQALDSVLWPILYDAGELLLYGNLDHVKECPGCGWLFLDTSKNQSRRWCSMNTCGARDKMRRYHKRKQTK